LTTICARFFTGLALSATVISLPRLRPMPSSCDRFSPRPRQTVSRGSLLAPRDQKRSESGNLSSSSKIPPHGVQNPLLLADVVIMKPSSRRAADVSSPLRLGEFSLFRAGAMKMCTAVSGDRAFEALRWPQCRCEATEHSIQSWSACCGWRANSTAAPKMVSVNLFAVIGPWREDGLLPVLQYLLDSES